MISLSSLHGPGPVDVTPDPSGVIMSMHVATTCLEHQFVSRHGLIQESVESGTTRSVVHPLLHQGMNNVMLLLIVIILMT